MKTQVLLLSALLILFVLTAQTDCGIIPGTLSVFVVDATSEAPILNAEVRLDSTRPPDTSGEGFYFFSVNGRHTLSVQADGYEPSTQSVSIEGSDITGITIYLTRSNDNGALWVQLADVNSMSPIKHGILTLSPNDIAVEYDSESGSYVAEGLLSGSYQLTISAIGYETTTFEVSISEGMITEEDVSLTPTVIDLPEFAALLTRNFEIYDLNNDARLDLLETQNVISHLNSTEFDTLDSDGDGYLMLTVGKELDVLTFVLESKL